MPESTLTHYVPGQPLVEISYEAAPFNPEATSAALRMAFAFLRRHGDRRYSASSLMKLLAFADRLDVENTLTDPDEFPRVIVAQVPFSFDADTEIKSGGVLGVAVVMQGGRTLLAVHQDKRREHIGAALVRYLKEYLTRNPVAWVHRENVGGCQFAFAQGLKPWAMNQTGALQFARNHPVEEEADGVAQCEDYEIDDRLRHQRPPAPNSGTRYPRLQMDEDCDEDGLRPWGDDEEDS